MTYLEKIRALDAHRAESACAERICAEIVYLDAVSKNEQDRYNATIEAAVDHVLAAVERDGAITKATVAEAEALLSDLAGAAKQYKAMFVAHAHIDMNWMWGYNETVSVTVETFRTVLTLMREYPQFTYAQSQASTYEIIEKYAPEMLPEIRQRIHEGRWEVTATEWVEPDKNLPDGESLTRQILQAKKYLCKLLELPADYFCLDFVPDTFGHNINVPEILNKAGIRYMYHCRGCDGQPDIYRYVSPSGKSTLNYREYEWYNSVVTSLAFEKVPGFCSKNKVNTCLHVYGVGDHGGGPSRRDIERILTYQSWPYTPTIEFGSFRSYFEELDRSGVEFPVVNEELNFIFTGCYTTQTRIKMANRLSEARMNETEALTAMAAELAGAPRQQEQLDGAWRSLLFNQFHDILPGSGSVETVEYAMGGFQNIMATASTESLRAIKQITDRIDTSGIAFDEDNNTVSEGGGVGFFQSEKKNFRMPSAERGRGSVRVLHVFNPTGHDRHGVTELTVWDYNYDLSLLQVTDVNGHSLEFEVLKDDHGYWGHKFTRILVEMAVPACGYTTVVISLKKPEGHACPAVLTHEHTDAHLQDLPYVLENEFISATFDHCTCQLTSLIDKKSGKELVSEPSCCFRLVQEEADGHYTAWRIGPYMNVQNLNESCAVKSGRLKCGAMQQWFEYEIKFGSSLLQVVVSLKKGGKMLEFEVSVDWHEPSVRKERIPQLNFAVPVNDAGERIAYDIPYGVLERPQLAHDVPALSYMGMNGVGIIADTKYGFRCWEDCGSVTLVRSPYNPDPYADQRKNSMRLAVAVAGNGELKELSDAFCHPLPFASGTCHSGDLPLQHSMLKLEGAVLSCVKNAEANDGTVVRVYNPGAEDQKATLQFARDIHRVLLTDTNERPVQELPVAGSAVTFDVPAYSVITVKIQ